MKYNVRCEIEVDADSPQGAVVKALQQCRIVQAFVVTPMDYKRGNRFRIRITKAVKVKREEIKLDLVIAALRNNGGWIR